MKLDVTEDQFERAARKICELRGTNPEEIIWADPTPGVFPFGTPVPKWLSVQKEITNLIMILEVLDEIIEEDELDALDALDNEVIPNVVE